MKKALTRSMNPTKILVVAFILMIALGTHLLSLPLATTDHRSVGLLNALFTAASVSQAFWW